MVEKYPELKTRLQSTFIDSILLLFFIWLCSSILERYEPVPDWVRIGLFAGIFGLYEPLCTTLGCTAGNYLFGIRVKKSSNTAARINLLQALIRYPVKVALGWISFLTIHGDSKRRALHDLLAGTVMIKLQ